MSLRTVLDPYGSDTVLVDKLIGNSYKIVRYVACHIEYIKHVSAHMAEIYRVAQSTEGLDAIIENIAMLDNLIDKLVLFETINSNLTTITEVHARLPEIQEIFDNLTEIMVVFNNIASVQTVATNIDELNDIAAQLTKLIAIYNELSSLVQIADNLDAILLSLDGADTVITSRIASKVVAQAGTNALALLSAQRGREAFGEPTGLLATLLTKASFAPEAGPLGFFTDYDCKGPILWRLDQNENQGAISGGGFRDNVFVQHIDRDVVDYSAIGQKVSVAVRGVTVGSFDSANGVFRQQYKDIIGADFHAIGRIGWAPRGVSGVVAGAIQYGIGIASNEFAVENPASGEQSMSMAGVQGIVSAFKAVDDASHVAVAFRGTNRGYRITAGFLLHSAPISGSYDGAFKYGIDMTLAKIEEVAIRLKGTGAGSKIIEYDDNDFSDFDPENNNFRWYVGGNAKLGVNPGGISIGNASVVARTWTFIEAGTSIKSHIYMYPGTPVTAPIPGEVWHGTDGLTGFGASGIIITTPATPASATAPGRQGTVQWDANYVYVCVATNTWKRHAITTWP